jgi:hypothetical protein
VKCWRLSRDELRTYNAARSDESRRMRVSSAERVIQGRHNAGDLSSNNGKVKSY